MDKPKKYNIDSFEKMFNIVNDKNFNGFITDFASWLRLSLEVAKDMRSRFPKETKGRLNSEILGTSFTWIDDGKNDLKGVTITHKATGEEVKIDFKDEDH